MAHPESISLFNRSVSYGIAVWSALAVQWLGILAGVVCAIWLPPIVGGGMSEFYTFIVVAGGCLILANTVLMLANRRLRLARAAALAHG